MHDLEEIDKKIRELKDRRIEMIKENELERLEHRSESIVLQKNLKDLMIRRKFSYQKLADKIGVSKQTVHKWCWHRKPISRTRYKQLMKIFDL